MEALATGFKTTSYLHTQLMEMNKVAARKKTSVFVVSVCEWNTKCEPIGVGCRCVHTQLTPTSYTDYYNWTDIYMAGGRASEANERNARLR